MVRVVVCVAVLTSGAAAQRPPAGQKPVPKVTLAPCNPISSIEGKDNFEAYCAVCHGHDAKGNGPAAPAMKAAVPDLTTIATRHGGKFDPLAIEYIVRGTGKTETPAHGVEEMPIWGVAFSTGDAAVRTMRIKNLVTYLESIQQPSTSR